MHDSFVEAGNVGDGNSLFVSNYNADCFFVETQHQVISAPHCIALYSNVGVIIFPVTYIHVVDTTPLVGFFHILPCFLRPIHSDI